MALEQCVEHKGLVSEVGDSYVKVSIQSSSACSGCHAKGVCGGYSEKPKEIIVPCTDGTYTVGESVTIQMKTSEGMKALLYGYVYPFFVILAFLITFKTMGMGDGKAGILALVSVALYYTLIYLLKNRLGRQFHFTITKAEEYL